MQDDDEAEEDRSAQSGGKRESEFMRIRALNERARLSRAFHRSHLRAADETLQQREDRIRRHHETYAAIQRKHAALTAGRLDDDEQHKKTMLPDFKTAAENLQTQIALERIMRAMENHSNQGYPQPVRNRDFDREM